jgi:hypothetical protein
MAFAFWLQPDDRTVIQPEPSSLRLLLRYLQPFSSPDTSYTLVVDQPPSSLNSAVIRRYRYPPNRTASLMMSFVSDSSSSRDFRTRRCVALGWLSTIQALRSDTAGNTRCTRSTHSRRREGLRSFPRPLLSGSACPGQDRQPFASAGRFPALAS